MEKKPISTIPQGHEDNSRVHKEVAATITTDPVVHILSVYINTLPDDQKIERIKMKGLMEQIDTINDLYKKLAHVATLPFYQQEAVLEDVSEQIAWWIPLSELAILQPKPITTTM